VFLNGLDGKRWQLRRRTLSSSNVIFPHFSAFLNKRRIPSIPLRGPLAERVDKVTSILARFKKYNTLANVFTR